MQAQLIRQMLSYSAEQRPNTLEILGHKIFIELGSPQSMHGMACTPPQQSFTPPVRPSLSPLLPEDEQHQPFALGSPAVSNCGGIPREKNGYLELKREEDNEFATYFCRIQNSNFLIYKDRDSKKASNYYQLPECKVKISSKLESATVYSQRQCSGHLSRSLFFGSARLASDLATREPKELILDKPEEQKEEGGEVRELNPGELLRNRGTRPHIMRNYLQKLN